MENGIGARSGLLSNVCVRLFDLVMAVALLPPILGGCASPGEPVARKPPVAEEITDLHAEQTANQVVLTFSLPNDTSH